MDLTKLLSTDPLKQFTSALPTTIAGKAASTVRLPTPKYTPPKVDSIDSTQHEELVKQTVEDLVEIEREFPDGGTQIVSYLHDLQVNVGGVFITPDTAPPISVVRGLPMPSKVSIQSKRTDVKSYTCNHVQTVDHAIPWGNYGILANNKFNVIAGAGGIILQTPGNIEITGGGRCTISSLYELNLTTSKGNINVYSGEGLMLRGEAVCIQTDKPTDQVIVNSNLGVARNLVVHGSTHIDGELFCHHITAPVVTRLTGDGAGSFGSLPSDTVIGYVDLTDLIDYMNSVLASNGFKWKNLKKFGIQSFANSSAGGAPTNVYKFGTHSNDDSGKAIHVHPHKHPYYTINSSLKKGNVQVRNSAIDDISSGEAGVAVEQIHGGFGLED